MRHSTFCMILWLCTALLVRGENFAVLFQDPADVLTYGEAHVTNRSTLLLTTVSSETSGVALYPSQVTAHVGFTTQFQWMTSNCNNLVNLAPSNYSDGVSFFMTPNPLSPTELESSQALLGIGKRSTLFAVAYVSTYNEFYVCEWVDTVPDNYDASLFRNNCRVFQNPSDRYTCGSYLFDISYNLFTTSLTVSVNGHQQFVAPTKVPAGRYYVGLAATNDVYARQQEVSAWTWNSKLLVDQFGPSGATLGYVYGAEITESGTIILNKDSKQASQTAVFYEHLVSPYNYFTSKFVFTKTNCLSGRGGLGFAMIFRKAPVLPIPRRLDDRDYMAAVHVGNTSVIGYSSSSNTFFICQTLIDTLPGSGEDDLCSPRESFLPPLSCSHAHQFEILYDSGVVQIYIDGKFAAAEKLDFDPEPYVIGFSGSKSKAGRGSQAVGNWVYDATNKPVVRTKFNLGTAHNGSLLLYGNAAVAGNKLNFTNSTPNFGIVLYDQPFPAHLGFKARIKYQGFPPENCQPKGHPTFDESQMIMFITSDRPTAEQLQNATVQTWGLQQLADVHVFSLDAMSLYLEYCNWGTNECFSIALPEEDRCLNYERTFDVIFTGQQIQLMRTPTSSTEFKTPNEMDEYTLNHTLTLPPKQYYVGMIGYNSLEELVVSDWTIQRYQSERTANFALSFASMQDHFTFINVARGDATNGEDFVRVGQAGLVVHNKPLWAHKGFSTTFTWSPVCNVEPQVTGFSMFLTKNELDIGVEIMSSAATGQFGTASLPGITSISYNRTENTFYAYFGGNSMRTTFNAISTKEQIRCDYPHVVQISYAISSGVLILVDDKLYAQLGADETGSIIERSYYYVGLAGEGIQQFSDWQYTAVVPHTQVIELGFDEETHLELFGTAFVTDGILRLTTGGSESGAAVYPVPVYAHAGFNASITWTPTNCDEENNGADGFTLFLTKNIPLYEDVYNSAGGWLGIGRVPNVVMFAYSATFSQFYVCDWTVPHILQFQDVCTAVEVPDTKYTCPDTYVFDYSYNHQILEIRTNGVSVVTTNVNLEPVQYYLGVSGSTAAGYFQQDISRLYFESTVL